MQFTYASAVKASLGAAERTTLHPPAMPLVAPLRFTAGPRPDQLSSLNPPPVILASSSQYVVTLTRQTEAPQVLVVAVPVLT